MHNLFFYGLLLFFIMKPLSNAGINLEIQWKALAIIAINLLIIGIIKRFVHSIKKSLLIWMMIVICLLLTPLQFCFLLTCIGFSLLGMSYHFHRTRPLWKIALNGEEHQIFFPNLNLKDQYFKPSFLTRTQWR